MSNSILDNINQDQAIVIGIVALIGIPVLMVGLLDITGLTSFSLITASITGDLTGSNLCVSGASDIQLDQTTTNLPSGEAWRIDVTSGDCNEYIIGGGGEIDEDEIEDGDYKAESGFQAGIENLETFIEIEIHEDPLSRTVSYPTEIYGNDIEVFECDEARRSSCVEDDWENVREWQDNGDDVFYSPIRDATSDSSVSGPADHLAVTQEFDANNIPFYGDNVIVASKPQFKGDVHEFAADQQHGFNADIVLCANNNCEPGSISHESGSATLDVTETIGSGNQQAEVTWQGSLMGDIFGLNTNKYLPAEEDGGTMNLANRELINEWDRQANNLNSCLSSLNDPENAETNCDVDSYANNAFADATSGLESDIAGIDSPNVDIDSRSMKIKPENHGTAFSRPSFIFDVNADWIGVAANEPEPRILNTQDFDLEQNDDITKEVQITNEGQDSHINLNAQCDGQLSATSDRNYVQEGQTETFKIGVNSGTIDAREYNCELTASSTAAGQGKEDTANFRATVLEDGEERNNDDNGNGDVVTPPPPPPPTPVWQYILIGGLAAALIGGLLYTSRDIMRKVVN